MPGTTLKTALAAMTAMGATLTLANAIVLDVPTRTPQITNAPVPVVDPRAFSGSGENGINRPRLNLIIKPSDLFPTDEAESACFYTSYVSMIKDLPYPTTDADLYRWLSKTAAHDVGTMTAPSQIADMCATTDDHIIPPTTLASAYAAFQEEFREWKVGFQDEAEDLARQCGRFGYAFLAVVATDPAQCRIAASGLFGYTASASLPVDTTATATATATVGGETKAGSVSVSVPRETATGFSDVRGGGTTGAEATGGSSGVDPKLEQSGAAGRGITAGLVGAVGVLVLAGLAGLW